MRRKVVVKPFVAQKSVKHDTAGPAGGYRRIEPGACLWCGHEVHVAPCVSTIRTTDDPAASCPCARHVWAQQRKPT